MSQKNQPTNEPISFGTQAFLFVVAILLLVILPWEIAKWFSHSALPFLPGSSEVLAKIERKYTSLKSTSSNNTRIAYHVTYSYTVQDRRHEGMTVVPRDFYEKLNVGQEFSLRHTNYEPSWSSPSEVPPNISDWIFFACAGVVILALWILAGMAFIYRNSQS